MSNHLPQCDCGMDYPGQGHPPDCPVRQAFEVLQSQLAEALKPSVCRWTLKFDDGVYWIMGCVKHPISQWSPYCPYCGGKVEVSDE